VRVRGGHGSGEGERTGENGRLIWKRRIKPGVGLKAVEPVLYSTIFLCLPASGKR